MMNPGIKISYTFDVTNTGNTVIGGPFTVNNSWLDDLSCADGTLLPGESLTCSGSYVTGALTGSG
jgi:hypothetical protein